MKRKVEGLFYHYTNGDIVNIKDLSKKEYEEFLDKMQQLIMAYTALINGGK